MKNKRLFGCIVAAIVAFACFFAVGCAKPASNVEPIVIVANDAAFDYSGKTLEDYMNFLQSGEQLTFEGSQSNYGLMVEKINGTEAPATMFWALYTSDVENANKAWGEYEYEGTKYGSATLGVSSLPVKAGCVYIWVLQSVNG